MPLHFLFLLTVLWGYGQKEDVLDRIISDFSLYSALPREVAYVHLNKSVYIKGEDLAFKAYVLDKDRKQPSQETRNLYCVLSDSADRMVKSQLVRITNGVGEGIFELDSLFYTGKYTFRAYTNWMRNFSETNSYQQSLHILDPETHPTLPDHPLPKELDVQILPEGGHAVAGLPSVYGVIIKDTGGYGVPEVAGSITDASGDTLTSFQTNRFGIGRLQLTPTRGSGYYLEFHHSEDVYKVPLPPAEPEGVVMGLSRFNDKVAVSLKARFNDAVLTQAPFYLTIHNGDSLKGIPVSFREGPEQLKVFPKKDLYRGINVFTLFDPNGEPLLERLCFNEAGLEFHDNLVGYVSREKDSVSIRLGIKGLNPDAFNSLSVSVVPSGSKANRAHHNITSSALLRPYVKGAIQDARYYFQDITARKQYELDNLLLTQGWSSYEWTRVFQNPPEYRFDFEKGIAYTVGFNSRRSDEFFIMPTYHNPSRLLRLEPGREQFTVEGFYPIEGEQLGISEIREAGKSRPTGAYVQFKPSEVPPLRSDRGNLLPGRLGRQYQEVSAPPISFQNLEKLQVLDEVVVSQKRRVSRLQKLQARTPGRVDIFTPNDPRRLMFLSTYLSGRGYSVNEELGRVDIRARNPNSPNNNRPIVYLDGVLLTDFDILWRFRLDIVDYIEVNPIGIGSGILGGGGVIRIVTDPALGGADILASRPYKTYPVPLSFGRKKRFYNPVYPSYTSDFFRLYGTIGWVPDLRPDQQGAIGFKAKPYGLEELELHVEGIVNGNEFVSSRIRLGTQME